MGEVRAFNQRITAAKDDVERDELRKSAMPDPTGMIEELIGIIEKDPQNIAVPAAARTVLQFNRMSKKPVDLPFVFKALTQHHLDSPDLAMTVVVSIYQRGNDDAEKFVNTVFQKSNNDLIQGIAAFGLAQKPGLSKDQQITYLETSLNKLGDSDYAFSNGRKLKTLVEGKLRNLRDLAVGALAPDIEGEDIEGVKFKLSDYRGKVVLLDFWGHW